MSDYINREDTIKAIESETYRHDYLDHVIDIIEDLPSADVAPVRHGRWIDKGYCAECSICGSLWEYDGVLDRNGIARIFRYCETCGSRMDGDSDETD